MMVKRLMHTLAVISVLWTGGCATTGGIKSAPISQGVARSFQHDFNATLKAAQQSIVETGLAIEEAIEIAPATWSIVAKKGATLMSMGELVRVVVEEVSPGTTQVRVLTQKRVATNVAARGDYSASILSNLDLKLR